MVQHKQITKVTERRQSHVRSLVFCKTFWVELSFFSQSPKVVFSTNCAFPLNTMNVTTVLEEKLVLFLPSAKIPEHEGSISPSSFYGQLRDYQSHMFSLTYPVSQFSFKRVKSWGQPKILSYYFVFGMDQKIQEARGVQDSLVQPQRWKPCQTESYLESLQTSVTELSCKNSQQP